MTMQERPRRAEEQCSLPAMPLARDSKSRPRYASTTLDKALAVLDCLSGHSRSLAAVCTDTGLNKTTVFRLLHVLESKGYVTRTRSGYALGYHLYEIALNVTESPLLRRLSRPHMAALQRQLEGVVHLGFMDRREVVCADRLEGSSRFNIKTHIGLRVEAHATALGKALLAIDSDENIARIYGSRAMPAQTARTVTDVRTLLRSLKSVRERRIAYCSGEYQADIQCWAVAVADDQNRPVCAISVSYPLGSVRPPDDAIATELLDCARTLRDRISSRPTLVAA